MWDALRDLRDKGSFILSIDIGGGTRGDVHVEKGNNNCFSVSCKAGRKMHKVFPLLVLFRNTISKGVLNSNWLEQVMYMQETIKGDRFYSKWTGIFK